jgi:hypothetical protein
MNLFFSNKMLFRLVPEWYGQHIDQATDCTTEESISSKPKRLFYSPKLPDRILGPRRLSSSGMGVL